MAQVRDPVSSKNDVSSERQFNKPLKDILYAVVNTANVFVINSTTFRSVPFPRTFLLYLLHLTVVYNK